MCFVTSKILIESKDKDFGLDFPRNSSSLIFNSNCIFFFFNFNVFFCFYPPFLMF